MLICCNFYPIKRFLETFLLKLCRKLKHCLKISRQLPQLSKLKQELNDFLQTWVIVSKGYGMLHGGYRSGGMEMRSERIQTQQIIITILSSVLLIEVFRLKGYIVQTIICKPKLRVGGWSHNRPVIRILLNIFLIDSKRM